MCMYLQIGSLSIPMYGLMIALGIVSANVLALFILKKNQLNVYDFVILEGYTLLGGFLGAKLLYLWVSRDLIDWSCIFEKEYFAAVFQGGFVFYGGLIGGIAAVFLGGMIHRIAPKVFLEKLIFLIPWIHCFGRIGCFCAGCCYGMPYEGVFSVVYPEGGMAPAGIPMFPIQLVEAICVLLIAVIILVSELKWNNSYTVELYLILYAIVRFTLEYFRYDKARGIFLTFSTSQWISILLIIGTVLELVIRIKRKKEQFFNFLLR